MKRLTVLAALLLSAGVSAQTCDSQFAALRAQYPNDIYEGPGNVWGLGNGLFESQGVGLLGTFNRTGPIKFDVTNGKLYKKVFLNQGDGIPAGLCSNITTMRNAYLSLFSSTGLCNGLVPSDGVGYAYVREMLGLSSSDEAWKIFNGLCTSGTCTWLAAQQTAASVCVENAKVAKLTTCAGVKAAFDACAPSTNPCGSSIFSGNAAAPGAPITSTFYAINQTISAARIVFPQAATQCPPASSAGTVGASAALVLSAALVAAAALA